jgi:hypothetical protein
MSGLGQEMFIVPKGAEHGPIVDEEAHVLLILLLIRNRAAGNAQYRSARHVT